MNKREKREKRRRNNKTTLYLERGARKQGGEKAGGVDTHTPAPPRRLGWPVGRVRTRKAECETELFIPAWKSSGCRTKPLACSIRAGWDRCRCPGRSRKARC